MITRTAKKLIYNIVIIGCLVAGLVYVCSRFLHLGRVEYTDNAQVKQHITPVNTRVQGFIQRICFDEYKPVHKGDTLVIIEDTEFRLRLAQAEADLANATVGTPYQFMRTGYFCLDNKDSKPGALVFNRSVSLKDSFKAK